MMRSIADNHGFTLIELVVIILVIGVLATIAGLRMSETIQTARFEQTKKELDQLTMAIVGNPDLYSHGTRSDFGFVGDNGTLPGSLDDLVQNLAGWSTWNGPYMQPGLSSDDFKRDAWNSYYQYVDTLIRSVGSGSSIDKLIAPSSAALLSNPVSGWVVDADREPPGPVNVDSITIVLTCPDGAGNVANIPTSPDAHGQFRYSGVPIGHHTLRIIHEPSGDTCSLAVTVYPGRDTSVDIVFPADLW